MDELGSRSDLEALQRSGRGKVITLMLLLVIALGAAGWFFFLRKQGTGNPEDPAKVMLVVTRSEYGLMLDEMGFEVAVGTFDAWVQKAKEEVPDLDVDGIEAIMKLADRFGYGYVIFEKPQEVDFSKLDIEEVPEMPEHVRFAVLSAGDFAFPHVMTVNPKPSDVLRGSSVVLLQALFAQEKLQQTLPDQEGSSIESIQLRDRLRDAIERLGQVPEAERLAEKIIQGVRHELQDEERAEPRPGLVGSILDSGVPMPLANGQLLTLTRSYQVVSNDAMKADLAREDTERLWVGKPGAEPDSRTLCEAVQGGEFSVHDALRMWTAEDGEALLTQTLGQGLTLWTLDPSAAGCGFVSRGSVPSPSPGLGDPVPAGHGQVARAGSIGSQGVVHVVTAGETDEQTLGMVDDVTFTEVQWLSSRYLAAVSGGYDGASGLYIMDTQTPMTVLRLTSTLFENAETLYGVAVGRRGDSPVIVVTAGDSPRKVFRLDLPATLPELFASPPKVSEPELDPAEAAAQAAAIAQGWAPPSREERGLPTIVELDTNRFPVTALTHEGLASQVTVSRDGRWVAMVVNGEMYDPTDMGDTEVAAVPIDGGSIRVLTRNALREQMPRLTADGSHAVFQTRVEVPKTDWVVNAARIVSLGGG